MWKKIVGILVCIMLIITIFLSVGATVNETDEKENSIVYESRIFGIGFVRIYKITHVIFGYVILGINDGLTIVKKWVIINFNEADEAFQLFLPSYVFYIRYNSE